MKFSKTKTILILIVIGGIISTVSLLILNWKRTRYEVTVKDKTPTLLNTEIYKDLGKSKSDTEQFRKTLQNFLTEGINNGFNYNDLRSIDVFYDKYMSDKYIGDDLLYYITFTRSSRIIYEYENNIQSLENICRDISNLFNLQENPNNRGGNVSTDISLDTKTSLKILSISYKCKDFSGLDYLFDKAIIAANTNILKGEDTIFIWFYDNNQIDKNIQWLSEKFNLDINELMITNENPEAIRIISFNKNFEPIKYKQFKSNQNSTLYKYRYDKNTFYVKDNHLFWKESDELVL